MTAAAAVKAAVVRGSGASRASGARALGREKEGGKKRGTKEKKDVSLRQRVKGPSAYNVCLFWVQASRVAALNTLKDLFTKRILLHNPYPRGFGLASVEKVQNGSVWHSVT